MTEPKLGDCSTCKLCGHRIEYIGFYWRHVGGFAPRHIAQPQSQGETVGGVGQEQGQERQGE